MNNYLSLMRRTSYLCFITIVGVVAFTSQRSNAGIDKKAIDSQIRQTRVFQLKNGTKVLYRIVPDSSLFEIGVFFRYGTSQLSLEQKPGLDLMTSTVFLGSDKYKKNDVYRIAEKTSLAFSCSEGIEVSNCMLGGVNDNLDEGLKLFASLLTKPTFISDDVEVRREQIRAGLKNEIQDPDSSSNDLVNSIFYGTSHPFYSSAVTNLAGLDKVSIKDLQNLHASMLASEKWIVVIGSKTKAEISGLLEKYFSGIVPGKAVETLVSQPVYDPKGVHSVFENKPIPTAYIKIKFNSTPVLGPDQVASKLMFRILDEKLGEEVRTKRSLSYGVYATPLFYSVGIGIISATTSLPKETIEVIGSTIKNFLLKPMSQKEVNEYKHIYETAYYLTLEEHSSLARALGNHLMYFGEVRSFYDFPLKLEAVSGEKIHELAKKILKKFWIGTVYSKEKFEEKWAADFVEKFSK